MRTPNLARLLLAHRADDAYGRHGEVLDELRPFLQRLRALVESIPSLSREDYRRLDITSLKLSTGSDAWVVDIERDFWDITKCQEVDNESGAARAGTEFAPATEVRHAVDTASLSPAAPPALEQGRHDSRKKRGKVGRPRTPEGRDAELADSYKALLPIMQDFVRELRTTAAGPGRKRFAQLLETTRETLNSGAFAEAPFTGLEFLDWNTASQEDNRVELNDARRATRRSLELSWLDFCCGKFQPSFLARAYAGFSFNLGEGRTANVLKPRSRRSRKPS